MRSDILHGPFVPCSLTTWVVLTGTPDTTADRAHPEEMSRTEKWLQRMADGAVRVLFRVSRVRS